MFKVCGLSLTTLWTWRALYPAPAFSRWVFTWSVFSNSFPFNLSVFLYTSCSSIKLAFVLFIQSDNLWVLLGIFNPFPFNIVTDVFMFKSTWFVFYLAYLFLVFFLSFLFFVTLFFLCISLLVTCAFYHSFSGYPRYFNVYHWLITINVKYTSI